MNEPNLDDLSILIPTKFSLVTLAMKRARQLKAGSHPLIDTPSRKPVTIALQEILLQKVRLGPQAPSEELEKEEQEAMLHAIGLSEPTSVSVTRRMEEIFGRDEEAGTEYDEDYEDYDDEEPEREEEEDEVEAEKDTLETDDEEEEEGLVGGGARRGADFLTDETQTEEIEEAALELEIDDEESDDDEEEEQAEVSGEIVVPTDEEAAKTEPAAKAPKAKAEKAPAAKKTAKVAKSDDSDEAPAKKPGRKPKA